MVAYVRAANVKDGALDLSDVKEMDFSPTEQRWFSLRPGDVLVSEGAGSLAAVGAAAVWNGELDGVVCFQNTLIRLRPRTGHDSRFLLWWARHAYGSGLFASVAEGANIYHLGADNVSRLRISIPPYSEQRAIADYLDAETARIDRVVAARAQQVELLGSRRRGLIDNQMAGGDDHWRRTRVKNLLLTIQQGWSPECEARPADADEWGVLKTGCANGGVFRGTENKALPSGVEPQRDLEIQEGDLILSRANTKSLLASVCVVPSVRPRLLLCDKLYRLVPSPNADAQFLAYALSTTQARERIEAEATGTSDSMQNISQATIRELSVLVPPTRDEQTQTAARLQKLLGHLDTVRAAMEGQIALLQERRQALITAAVTGQIEVRGVAA
jgi:type I restriction enzyme, S subunit